MIPILYILGKGSKFNNDELRYSLRSLERYLPNAERVIVLGENPRFLSDKVEYRRLDEVRGNKEYRISQKVKYACKRLIKGDFLFLNDDYFFTDTFTKEPKEGYNFSKGNLRENTGNYTYRKSCLETANYLESLGKETYNFDVHFPIVYNSEKYLELDYAWEYSKTLYTGLVVKSTYCNIHGYKAEPLMDVKLSRLQTELDYKKICPNQMFSCSDKGWVNGIEGYLKSEFPDKSKYEL